MRPDRLQVVLRPRPVWEAVELRHARAVWRPWLLLSVPVLMVANALGWWLDLVWLAGILMWWLLPLFDRIPLYVLSRAVFGQAPGSSETLRAWPRVGPGYIASHLLWRRFGLWRAQCLPVDLLEGGSVADKIQRRRLLLSGQRGSGALLTWLCLGFAIITILGAVMLGFLFVPGKELLPESVRIVMAGLVQHPPRWVQLLWNALCWLGFTLIEPFYIGAGFGLYLNRRVVLEGWEIELALRGLKARLGKARKPPLTAMLLALCLALTHVPLLAKDSAPPAGADNIQTLGDLFGPRPVEGIDDFLAAQEAARHDPLLNRQQSRHRWVRKTPAAPIARPSSAASRWQLPQTWVSALSGLSEGILWLLLAALAGLLLLTLPRWLPWMRYTGRRRNRIASKQMQMNVPESPLLPNPGARARELWQAGDKRRALALLYRGSLNSLPALTGIELPRAATEAECLHVARHLPTPGQRRIFACLVHIWQGAAYARCLPDDAAFNVLSAELARNFRWPP